MQGKSNPGRQMLDAAAFCRGLVEEGTVFSFLADHRDELFKDEDFAGSTRLSAESLFGSSADLVVTAK
jgi:hypothetical protein